MTRAYQSGTELPRAFRAETTTTKTVRWSSVPPTVHCIERLALIAIVGDARDAANPNFGLLAMSRAARLAAFAEGHVARKLLIAWRAEARREREEKERHEERHQETEERRQLERQEAACRPKQRPRRNSTRRAPPRILVLTASDERPGTLHSLDRFEQTA